MMNKITTCRLTLLVAGLGIATLAGCGAPPAALPREAVFYPALPDQPRIQFLTTFNSAEQWLTKASSFREFVTGETTTGDSGWFKSPYGVEAHNGKLFVCDLGRKRVHVIDAANRSYSTLGRPDTFRNPVNIAIGPDGRRYVCDTGLAMVLVFDPSDRFERSFGDGKLFVPGDIAVTANELYIADMRDGEIEVFDHNGARLRTISSKGPGPDQLQMPTNLDIGPEGNIYVTDTFQQIVKVFDPQGNFRGTIGRPGDRPGNFARPKGIAVAAPGHVYVADAQWEKIQVFRPDGQLLLFFGEAGPQPDSLGLPAAVAVDTTSIEAFREFIDPDFEPEYLLIVANQFYQQGRGKVNVYAFGRYTGKLPPAPSRTPTADGATSDEAASDGTASDEASSDQAATD